MEIIKCVGKNGVLRIPEKKMKHIVSELAGGRLVVYPTETVYGLGCDPLDETAVKRIFMAKRRPFDMAMSLAVKDLKQMEELAFMDDRARKLVRTFMPGPLTLILPKKPVVPDILTASTNEIGVRIPDHPIAIKLIEEFGPIVTTSANIHSHKDPVTCQDAIEDLGPTVSIYLDAGASKIGRASTIVQLRDGDVELIRSGAISTETIKAALNE